MITNNARADRERLWIRIDKVTPMSTEGFKRWGIKQRPNISKHMKVYRPIMFFMRNNKLHYSHLVSDESIMKWMSTLSIDEGEYNVYGRTGAKNKFHSKPCLLFKAKIQDKENNKIEINTTVKTKSGKYINRLSKYWFRRKKKEVKTNG